MSEYQRFISYMYEYRGNNRFANCGYARIDNRNQLLKLEIHMKISSQSTEEPIHIYGCFHCSYLRFVSSYLPVSLHGGGPFFKTCTL